MIVHATFHIHPDSKEKAKAEVRELKSVIERNKGTVTARVAVSYLIRKGAEVTTFVK